MSQLPSSSFSQSKLDADTPPPATWSVITRAHFLWVSALGLIIGIVAAIQGTASYIYQPGAAFSDYNQLHGSDLVSFFYPAAQRIIDGDPWTIYAVRAFGSYPNYNPPLGTLILAPVITVARAIHLPGIAACVDAGYASNSCRSLLGFTGIAFMPFIFLMGLSALVALRLANPRISRGQELLVYALIILSPLTWQNYTGWWHFEQPMMLAFLIAACSQVQARRTWLAGILLGLALLSRTTAAVPIAALFIVFIAEQAWARLLQVGAAMVATAAIGFGPFFLFDFSDTSFSLLKWRGGAAIGNSIWAIFIGTPLDGIARRLDLYTALLAAAVLAYIAVKRFGVTAQSHHLYAVLGIAALLVPMLSKTNWPYYYAEPFVFLVIWEFASLQRTPVGIWRWPVISLVYLSMAMILSQFMGLPSVTSGGLVLRLMGLVQFIAIGACIWAVWQRLSESSFFERTEGNARFG